ncbi:hypothetical protein AURDEDRAFT_170798 [Auricularia subglabra TFB-10046 SS5]|nr:hypothetical protein AURDEDRAFT_170798 [Auricularia subglabra TFB-10046 SS5]
MFNGSRRTVRCSSQTIKVIYLTPIVITLTSIAGAGRILTDPQILTASEFTNNFADGNVLAGWESMTAHHKCNDYCKFFGLVSPSLQKDELAQRRAAVAKAAPGGEEPAPAVEG